MKEGIFVTANMLLSMCLGCSKCEGVYAYSRLIYTIYNNQVFFIKDRQMSNSITIRQSAYSSSELLSRGKKVESIDELKNYMRADNYRYEV